jgi:hypothetical protein
MYEFIFEDTTPPTHCENPVISGASGKRCNATVCKSNESSHHACANNIGADTHMYCECSQNKDMDEQGKRIRHYFRENKLSGELRCPSCRANCL